MRAIAISILLAAATLSACADDDDTAQAPGTVRSLNTASPSGAGSGSGSGSASASVADVPREAAGAGGPYVPVSDVVPHAAIGRDAAAIRALMAPAAEGGSVEWDEVGELFREGGGASVKGDGSTRTLESLVAEHPAIDSVNAAIDGSGESEDASDAVRRQYVDKGIMAILAAKVDGELGTAEEKLRDGKQTDPASGAPHNVDEAWAFFLAEGQGPVSTAEKRGADFDLDLRQPVFDGLNAALRASLAGDVTALTEAREQTKAAVDHIFYLATYKYLDTEGDEIKQAEGEAFYLAIAATVRAASTEADEAIRAALAAGDTDAGRAALNRPEVREALGIDDEEIPD